MSTAPLGVSAAEPSAPPPAAEPPPDFTTTVTATRGRRIGTSPLATSVLTSREITTAPARTTDELLRVVPGVSLPRSDGRALHPTAQALSLRGVGRGRALVLVDGLPLNDPFGGWIQWNKIAKSQVDRLEIVRGASSSLYGSLAMGGVIQAFTRPTDRPRLLLEADYGDRDSAHLAAFAATPIGSHFGVTASIDATRTDGYFQIAPAMRGLVDVASRYESQNAAVRGTWQRGLWSGFASFNYFREERGSGTLRTENRQWIGDASAGATANLGPGKLELLLFGGQQRFHNANSRVDAARQSEVLALKQTIPVDQGGGSVLWTQAIGERQDLTAGVDLRWVAATNLEDVFSSTGTFTGSRSAGGQQSVGGVFADWSVRPLDWLTLSAGARADGWWNFGGRQVSTAGVTTLQPQKRDGALSPRLSAIVRVNEALALRGAAYSGFRAPNLNELYRGFFSGTYLVIPNPELGAERLLGGELGVDWSPRSGTRLSATGYVDRTTDRIETISLDATTRQRRNVAAAESAGAELEASWRPLPELRLAGSYTLAFSRISSFPDNATLEGKELPGLPRHAGALTARWSSAQWVDLTVRLRAEGEQFADEKNTLTLPAFALVDVSISRQLREEVELFASISNLLDAQVITERTQTLDRIGAPRSAWAGFRVRY